MRKDTKRCGHNTIISSASPAHSPERARAIAEANKKHWYAYFLCYAVSRDGKHWDKPMLDLHPYRDYSKTNIVLVGETEVEQTNIWLNDDQTNPARRHLMTYTDNLVDQSKAESLSWPTPPMASTGRWTGRRHRF